MISLICARAAVALTSKSRAMISIPGSAPWTMDA